MSQENSLNMLDKYFKPRRITQIIGESSSLKESFISIYIAYKAIETSSKIIFIYSKPNIYLNYIYQVHKNFEKEKFPSNYLKEQYFFFEFVKFDSMGEFILKNLPILLEKEKNVSTIILNNLNNFFSSNSYKFSHDHRIYSNQLLYLARKYNLNIIYLNDFFYYCETKFLSNRNNINYIDPNNNINEIKSNNNNININMEEKINDNNKYDDNKENEDDNNNEIESYYNKEPVNSDLLAEYCSHILIAENRKQRAYYGSFGEDDCIEQGIFRVIKSNYKPHQKYLVTINKKNFSYNIEIN